MKELFKWIHKLPPRIDKWRAEFSFLSLWFTSAPASINIRTIFVWSERRINRINWCSNWNLSAFAKLSNLNPRNYFSWLPSITVYIHPYLLYSKNDCSPTCQQSHRDLCNNWQHLAKDNQKIAWIFFVWKFTNFIYPTGLNVVSHIW